MFIYQQSEWPKFKWDSSALINLLGEVRNLQGKLLGKISSIGFDLQCEASLATLTSDVLKSSEIEGEILNPDQVRSSLAHHLGIDISNPVHYSRDVDGIVEMMLDATQHFSEALTAERLFSWHGSLFPAGRSGLLKIGVGNWRNDKHGPMVVVSGALGNEHVRFQAPEASRIPQEIDCFLHWFNSEQNLDILLKAGIAHFWFITIHPFDDGNGRIARAITDMLLARADGSKQRFYNMSAQIMAQKNRYYDILEKSQKGTVDITKWLIWFLGCLKDSIESSDTIISSVLHKQKFWSKFSGIAFNDRQIMMINKLLDNFTGKLTSSKWATITKCSTDTALRDIQDLIQKKILEKDSTGGRSTSYHLVQLP